MPVSSAARAATFATGLLVIGCAAPCPVSAGRVSSTKRWVVDDPLPEAAASRLTQAGYPLLIAQLLYNRNAADAEAAHRFLEGELAGPDAPELLLGMEA